MIRLALFFLVLFLAAVSDIRKRIIPDWMPFLIAGVSLIPSEPVYLTGLFVALPLLIAGITVGGIGGGDIKLTGACGLVLGFERTLAGLLMALMFLLLFHWAGQCIRKCKKIIGQLCMLILIATYNSSTCHRQEHLKIKVR